MCITLLCRWSMWDRRGLDRKPCKADDGVVFAGRFVDTNVVGVVVVVVVLVVLVPVVVGGGFLCLFLY